MGICIVVIVIRSEAILQKMKNRSHKTNGKEKKVENTKDDGRNVVNERE